MCLVRSLASVVLQVGVLAGLSARDICNSGGREVCKVRMEICVEVSHHEAVDDWTQVWWVRVVLLLLLPGLIGLLVACRIRCRG